MKSFHLTLLAVTLLFSGALHSLGQTPPPPGQIFTTGSITLTPLGGSSNFDVTPGGSFTMDVNVFLSSSADSIKGFSFTIAGLTDFDSEFSVSSPLSSSGWEFTTSGDTVTAVNNGPASNDILGGSPQVAGLIEFTVAPNAPVNTAFSLPYPSIFSITDTDGANISLINGHSAGDPIVADAVPEPSTAPLMAMGLLVTLLGVWRRQPRLKGLAVKSSRSSR